MIGSVGYLAWFAGLLLVCVLVVMRTQDSTNVSVTVDFKGFQRNFLAVFLIMSLADWLQGPYVYALYASYGFTNAQIAQLFIVGFGSSMVFGTFVAGFADRFGRKANVILFGVAYSLSCLTKHFNDFQILMIGRILGGIATSILMSVFETWMIHEHHRNAYPDTWLSHTFALMTFGNGIIAILAGLVASAVTPYFGLVAPFDVSLLLLIVGTLVVSSTWKENYGDRFATGFSNFSDAATLLYSNERVALLGIIQSFFEASMYLFVFEWTPALEAEGVALPHGLVFAGFMVCIMIGSSLFKYFIQSYEPENIARYVFLVSCVCLSMPVLTENHVMRLMAFCGFELCCGLYFPCVGTMRSKYIPEEIRSTVMNIFRIGLNVIVVAVLLNTERVSMLGVFATSAVALALGLVAQHRLFTLGLSNQPASERAKQGLERGEEVDEALTSKQDIQD